MFVLSGFSGLLYQVVWTRLAFASFGVNTPVLSVVISVFMAGLALGTWASGRWVANYKRTNTRSSIFYYGLVECGIVVGALVVPTCFSYGEELLKASSEAGSFLYLTKSSILIGVTLLPWCFFMGCTYPLMAG
jgi:spermidine synthase